MFCQVSFDGTQAGCTMYIHHIYIYIANIPPSVADTSLDGYQLARNSYRHICGRCGSEFKHGSQLCRHVNMKHGDVKQFICAQCNCSYVYKRVLRQHMNTFHKKLYRYRCETCEKGFMDRSRYFDHVAAHTGVKRHSCSMCEMRFMNKTSLKNMFYIFIRTRQRIFYE